MRITGHRLGRVAEVDFRGASGDLATAPAAASRRRLEVRVPAGALTGHPRAVDSAGHGSATRRRLRIVGARRLPPRGGFDLMGARVHPRKAFVDARRSVRLRYRFRSYGPVDLTVKALHRGRIVRRWSERGRLPYAPHRLVWNGMRSHRHAAPPGRYRFKLKAPRHPARTSATFRLYDGKFPVRGPHGYGGPEQRFGAPRNGGRVHEGQDVFAPCGTPVVAARGGRVQARGSDPVLYGNWVVVDARGTRTDYRYAHFIQPASVHDGERVRTGERIARVGKTGNARTVGCMLHLEVWPSGWHRGSPIDPLPILRRWDSWS